MNTEVRESSNYCCHIYASNAVHDFMYIRFHTTIYAVSLIDIPATVASLKYKVYERSVAYEL